jgi:hypothetical protein
MVVAQDAADNPVEAVVFKCASTHGSLGRSRKRVTRGCV